jgi:hypothetical protein
LWHLVEQARTVLVIVLSVPFLFSGCGKSASQLAAEQKLVEEQAAVEKRAAEQKAAAEKREAEQKAAAKAAVQALKKMSGATEIGLNIMEYNKRLIDLKGDVDEAVEQLPEGELKREISDAMDAYVDAMEVWRKEFVEFDFALTEFEPARTLQKKYAIPQEQSSSSGMLIRKNVTLSIIWSAASQHVDRASSLLKQH